MPFNFLSAASLGTRVYEYCSAPPYRQRTPLHDDSASTIQRLLLPTTRIHSHLRLGMPGGLGSGGLPMSPPSKTVILLSDVSSLGDGVISFRYNLRPFDLLLVLIRICNKNKLRLPSLVTRYKSRMSLAYFFSGSLRL